MALQNANASIRCLGIIFMCDITEIWSKRRISLQQCHLGKSSPHPQQWPTKSAAQAQNAGFPAGGAPQGPHLPTATDPVGMKDPDNKPRLTQNGGRRLLADRSWGFPLAMCEINSPLRFHAVLLTPRVKEEKGASEGVRKEGWKATKLKGY